MKVNGSLQFDASSASELQNLRVQKYEGGSVPTWQTSDTGRLIFVTAAGGVYLANTVYVGDAGSSSWKALASGSVAFSQVEGDAIETSLGAGINSDGTFNAAGFPAQAGLVSPTSFTDAINQIAAYATANNTLFELDDVSLSAAVPVGAKFLYTAGGANWVDHTLVLADVSDVDTTAAELNELNTSGAVLADFVKLHAVTASATELNVLDGITASTVELNYVDGVTSPIQAQLDGLQAEDLGLTSLAALTGPGFVTVNVDGNTFSARTFTQPTEGLTITFTDGSGSPVFALANDLAGLEGLTSTGIAVRTGTSTWATTEITGTAGRIGVTNGDAVAGDPTIDLVALTDGGTGTFLKITRDAYGRVSGTEAVVAGDITPLVDATYVNISGDSMTGTLAMGGNKITGVGDPTGGQDAATKAYVDSVAEGLAVKPAVLAATTGTLATTTGVGVVYANGTAGVGATLTIGVTGTGTGLAALTVDGVSLTAEFDGILVKDEANPANNGRYFVSTVGDIDTAWVLTRCTYCDENTEIPSSFVFVQGGTVNGATGWAALVENPAGFTVGTDDITWTQFSGAGAYTAGTGLSLSGTVFNVNLGAGIFELGTDNVGIELHSSTSGGLILTTDGSTRSVDNASKLFLLLKSAGGLTQDTDGLYIPAAGVTNAMLANSTLSATADSGSEVINLGDTLHLDGDATQGLSFAVAKAGAIVTYTGTISSATSTQLGVATFNTADFAVTAGDVTIKAGGVSNAQLVNSTITIAGTSGSDAVALGETLTFSSTVSGLVSSAVATNGVALDVRLATASLTGVVSISTGLAVDGSGAVTLNSALDGLTDVSGTTAAANGTVLRKVGGSWTAVATAALAADIDLTDLGDVTVTAGAAGQVLSLNGSAEWVNKKIYHKEAFTAATSWTATHGLGEQFVVATVYDASNEVVIPQSITAGATTTTVTFNTAVAGTLVLMAVA